MKHRFFLSIWIILVIAALLAPLVLTGCQPPDPKLVDTGRKIIKVKEKTIAPYETVVIDGVEYKQSRYPVGRHGGTFYSSSIGRAPRTFNPHASKDATSSSIASLMFTGLTETDPYTGETIPHLAKEVELKPDNVTYVVTLRHGLKWSDGHPLTADDVVFTWNEILKTGLGNASNRDVIMINGKLPSVRKIDDLTIEFRTPEPFAPFLGNLGSAILPKHVVEPVIRNNPKAFDSFWGVSADPKTFVCNNMFVLDEYVSGQRVILKRNPHFFMVDRKNQKLPYFDRYVMDFVQDQNAQMMMFQKGKTDYVSIPGSEVFYVKHHLQGGPEFTIYDLGPASGTIFMVFNLNPRINKETGKPYLRPEASRWFRNLYFRKAVDYAIRRDQIVQNLLMGVGSPLYTAESLSSVFLNEKLAKGHPADLEQAKAYLRKGGFKWRADGRLIDSQGVPVEFELITNSGNLEREAVGVSIKEDLEKLGIKVNFKSIDFNVLVGKMESSSWEAVIIGLTGSNIEPHGGVNVWRSDGALHLFNQRNPMRDKPGSDIIEPWERELDRLFTLGATTLDKEKRKEIYDQYQQVVYDNLPVIYLYSPMSIVAVNNRIQNIDPTPLGGVTHNLESLWIKED